MVPIAEIFGGPSTHQDDITSPLKCQQIQSPQTKYGVQEEIEGRNVSTTSILFSGGAPTEVGGNLAENRG